MLNLKFTCAVVAGPMCACRTFEVRSCYWVTSQKVTFKLDMSGRQCCTESHLTLGTQSTAVSLQTSGNNVHKVE